MVGILRVRLMVGHIPLEDGIGVRVPDPQQKTKGFLLPKALGVLWQGLENLLPYFRDFLKARKWERCTEAVSFEKRTRDP